MGDLHAEEAGECGEARWLARNKCIDAAPLESHQRLHSLEGNKFAAAHDGNAVADALHFADEVATEEDGTASCSALQEQLLQRTLHQRIETLGRLIENQQLRVSLKCLHHADLLAHAAAVVAHRSLQDRIGEFERLHDAMAEE